LSKAIIQFASGSAHFTASLEILSELSLNKANCYYSYWGSRTKYPGRMSKHFESINKKLPVRAFNLIKLANSKVKILDEMIFDKSWVDQKKNNLFYLVSFVYTVDELRQLSFTGSKIGQVLVNEITTITKNRSFKPTEHLSLLKLLIESYLQVYSATLLLIKQNNLEKIFIYNGRFIHERAVSEAAQSLGIKVVFFETMRNRYLTRSEGFHNRISNQNYMIKHWNNSLGTMNSKLNIGSKYFTELRSLANPFHNKQVPENVDLKPYFVYFSSSDDEVAGLWDEPVENLGDQITCIQNLQSIFDLQNKYSLIIRIHPNLMNKSKEQIMDWSKIIDSKSSKVISHTNKTSSYYLLDNAIGAITYGSTLGLEAAFSKKPSLILSDCSYDELSVVTKAKNWEQVRNWITFSHKMSEGDLEKRSNNACIRGYYLATAGKFFTNTELVEKGWGSWEAITYKGKPVREFLLLYYYRIALSKIKYIIYMNRY
jgi:hypothetical protein